jgi:ATP-dependent exoDNAse (exonuclease V) alpha subunit
MQLDQDNKEFNLAVDFVENSRKNLFLTGKAGTGKTTFLRYIKDNVDKNLAIVAPTGIAAINAGGVTIHSFFQISPSVYPPTDKRLRTKAPQGVEDRSTIFNHFRYFENKKKVLRELEVLVIDEISMVRCDLLDVIDKLLRVFGGGNQAYPFGGKQVILIGDPFQLPPVAKDTDWQILAPFYDTPFFFSAKAFQKANLIPIELQKIYRQSDPDFISLLNNIRSNRTTTEDLRTINSRTYWEDEIYDKEIMLSTHNRSVNAINRRKLDSLEGRPYKYIGRATGRFRTAEYPTELELRLKVGAQVIFVKNDVGEDRQYYNGKIVTVSSLSEEEIEVIDEKGKTISVEKETWEKIEYEWDKNEKEIKEKIIGTFSQFPIKLAWAITIHKSQGLTFDRVVLDLQKAFAPGQVYVALSRCTTLKGIRMKEKISHQQIITSKEVADFYDSCNF